jgi:predicted nucleic acid-binding protein
VCTSSSPSTSWSAAAARRSCERHIALPRIQTTDADSLLHALAIYEVDRLHFAEAYLVAHAEATGVAEIVSFDRSIHRVGTVVRREP